MIGFILITILFIGALVGFQKLLDVEKIKSDWPKYRCRPDVMLMAGLYGYDAAENFDFCLANGFNERAKGAISPFYTFLTQFVNILMTLLKSINSIRMVFATIVGSVTQVFTEFSGRIQSFFYSIQTTSLRIKFLFQRVFATMTSILFMGMSGIRATTNFGNTFLFKFLDTFCFDPDTPVSIVSKGRIPICNVQIGDVFADSGDRVTATFQFAADGQPMVRLKNNILVSTNHFLYHNHKWIHSAEHPDAVDAGPWDGGNQRPLICLNTESHSFPIGQYIFRDYDETEEGDEETMKEVLKGLNGGLQTCSCSTIPSYTTCIHPETKIRTRNNGPVPAKDIVLGTELSFGQVVGIVQKEVNEICRIEKTTLTPGCALWCKKDLCWKRASDIGEKSVLPEPANYISFVVTPSAIIETEEGLCIRDYVEIHSPDTENAYAQILRNTINHTQQIAGVECKS